MRKRLKCNALNGSGSIPAVDRQGCEWKGGTDANGPLCSPMLSPPKGSEATRPLPVLLVHGGGCVSLPSPAFTWLPFNKS